MKKTMLTTIALIAALATPVPGMAEQEGPNTQAQIASAVHDAGLWLAAEAHAARVLCADDVPVETVNRHLLIHGSAWAFRHGLHQEVAGTMINEAGVRLIGAIQQSPQQEQDDFCTYVRMKF